MYDDGRRYLKNEHFYNILNPFEDVRHMKNIYNIDRLSSKAVKVFNQYEINVIYIDTIILKYNKKDNTIKLNSGGWFSNTTKKHINSALINYGYHVKQNDFKWYLVNNKNGDVVDYFDNMTIKVK